VFEKVQEQYGDQAEKFQVKITKPTTFQDLLACIDAGYPVEFGTTKKAKLGGDGYWMLSGSTNHAMNYAFRKSGYIGLTNSWNDGFGWLAVNLAEQQCNPASCFVVLDIERTRKGKANY